MTEKRSAADALRALRMADPSGILPAATLTGGNRNDVTKLLPLLDGLGPVEGKIGWPRQLANSLLADRGYEHDKYRRELSARGASRSSSPDDPPSTARGWASAAGSSSGPSPGCTSSAA